MATPLGSADAFPSFTFPRSRQHARRESKRFLRAKGGLPVESTEISKAIFLGFGLISGVGADTKQQVEHVCLNPDRPVK